MTALRESTALRGGSAVAAAIVTMNVATYGFTILAARLLGPHTFGAVAAVMNVLLVASVVALGIQATAARRIARSPGSAAAIERVVLAVSLRAALVLGVGLAVLSPVVATVLHLDSLLSALLLAAAVVPGTVMGAQSGVLQGEHRWAGLGAIYLSLGLARFGIGAAVMLWQPDEVWTIAAVAVAAIVPVLVGAVALRGGVSAGSTDEDSPTDGGGSVGQGGSASAGALWWETVHNSHALFAFMVLSNVDVVLARAALDAHDAGLYAAGLIMVKAVLFLPQFVVVIAFPSMGADTLRRTALVTSLAVVGALGGVVVAGTAVLSAAALEFVGGREYAEVQDRLWLFAIVGTCLSLLQLLVYHVLARQSRRSVFVVWAAVIAVIAAGLTSGSVPDLIGRVLAVDAALLAVLLALSGPLRASSRRSRSRRRAAR